MERMWRQMRADMEKLAEMEAVRQIAESYYHAASPKVREQARIFFKSMDRNRNRRIDLEEFLEFMRHEGYIHMENNSFFRMLDTNGHGSLTFMDVMTLYYIIKSGRPFCGGCREFIPGTFFSCVTCFNYQQNSFNICRHCHKSKNYHHNHHDGRHALFLDNFTLLQATKFDSPTNQAWQRNRATPTAYNNNMMNDGSRRSRGSSFSTVTAASAQNAIVLSTQRGEWWWNAASASLKALDKLIILGNFVTAVSSSCTIM